MKKLLTIAILSLAAQAAFCGVNVTAQCHLYVENQKYYDKIEKFGADNVFAQQSYDEHLAHPEKHQADKARCDKALADQAEEVRVSKLPNIKFGMSKDQVAFHSNWGQPDSINRTSTPNSTREQWVYEGGGYLYFTNGKLTAIQN